MLAGKGESVSTLLPLLQSHPHVRSPPASNSRTDHTAQARSRASVSGWFLESVYQAAVITKQAFSENNHGAEAQNKPVHDGSLAPGMPRMFLSLYSDCSSAVKVHTYPPATRCGIRIFPLLRLTFEALLPAVRRFIYPLKLLAAKSNMLV